MALASLKTYNKVITIASLIAIQLSGYSLYVEMSAESSSDYRAMCDISERVSCSKVFTSIYGKGFGLVAKDSPFYIPNGGNGIIFYTFLIWLGLHENLTWIRLQVGLSLTSLLVSCYLAYILYFVLNDFCVICVSIYIINIINAIFTVMKLVTYKRAIAATHKKKNK